MKITFQIHFHTVWGQELYLTGSHPLLGNWQQAAAQAMIHRGGGYWFYELELPDSAVELEYRYLLRSGDLLLLSEWNRNHQLSITECDRSYQLIDQWQNKPNDSAFYSSAFTQSIFAHSCDQFAHTELASKRLMIKIQAPLLGQHERLALLGNQPELGNWNTNRPLLMGCEASPEWWVELDAAHLHFPLEYKFCTVSETDHQFIRWEEGENRVLDLQSTGDDQTIIVSGLTFCDKPSAWKGAGVVIPIFSLRTEKSFGIGDFADLYRLVDWAKATGMEVIQTLPINDTTMTHTWNDSYPYNAISIYALHPLYLSLDKMGQLTDPDRRDFYATKQQELNALYELDYEAVDKYKWAFFEELFAQEGEEVLTTQEFAGFFADNSDWLIPYAAFAYLREKYGTADFSLWDDYKTFNQDEINKLCHPQSDSYRAIGLYYFLQYHLYRQLRDVRRYAHQQGVILKGDIPIGISRRSVEAWKEPSYFRMDFQTGAPPDAFSATGQNWGFPTYNWLRMEEDNYYWWKKRFRKMAEYFDAYRIDHILGFFRIWTIPYESIEGVLGYFNPALPLSIDEITRNGMTFRRERYTQASIHEDYLGELFDEYADEVKQLYLDQSSAQCFVAKEAFNTQRKVHEYFEGRMDHKSLAIRQGLFALCNEVLFIEDKEQTGYWHPRISAFSTYLYRDLDDADRQAFDRLYQDYFYYRHNDYWKEQAYKKLSPLIDATDMLVCGEDLGMIPQSVPEVMERLQILSLEIERMPKTMGVEFADLAHLPYLSVCTTSTHDMSTIRGWWQEDRDKTQRYYNQVLRMEGEAPGSCSGELCEQIVVNHLCSSSMLCLLPLQDWLAIDESLRSDEIEQERINIPANPHHYWRYRMHLTIEELLEEERFNNKLSELIKMRKG